MQVCHYCRKQPGNTIDHIVARALLPKEYPNVLPMWFHQKNRVPACNDCNHTKNYYKAECVCNRCREAWKMARLYLEPINRWYEPPTISIWEITGGRVTTNDDGVIDIKEVYPDWPYDREKGTVHD